MALENNNFDSQVEIFNAHAASNGLTLAACQICDLMRLAEARLKDLAETSPDMPPFTAADVITLTGHIAEQYRFSEPL